MVEFEAYIERRARCQAFQFVDPLDAQLIAQSLYWNAWDWVLTRKGDGFTLEVKLPGAQSVIVNRGDYLVRDTPDQPVTVVPLAEFRPEWELD